MSDSIDNNHPVGGVDYPRTIQEFDEWFPNENACVAYLLRIRWPNGFICPVCGGAKVGCPKRYKPFPNFWL
ncbi:MAG: transposase [Desulfobacterales bacterium]|nr:transposase [Desulfobacterales bacterium]